MNSTEAPKRGKKNLACSLSIAATSKQTIGLMGGSFNPAHSGHRLISELAIKRLGLNKVWWLVSPQNPLKLSAGMANIEERVQTAVKISRNPKIKVMTIESFLGTQYTSIDLAEDRDRFRNLLNKLNLKQAESGIARTFAQAIKIADKIGLPLMVRPSYVLGGRAMEIVHEKNQLKDFVKEAFKVAEKNPILIDKFIDNAMEVDVDAISDGKNVFVAGIMQHIEEAGIHSGDSACSLPPVSIKPFLIKEIENQTKKLALALKVKGFMNVQYAIKKDQIYVIEVNPRASRTVPFVSKAKNLPLAKIASRVMAGEKLSKFNLKSKTKDMFAVKEAVFPFNKFPNSDLLLGPEMKSTGEVWVSMKILVWLLPKVKWQLLTRFLQKV